jgi:hypothetical protein
MPEPVETFTVTFERTVTVQVPASLVPPDWRPPRRLHHWPDPLYDAVTQAAESADPADATESLVEIRYDRLEEGSTG